MEAKTNEATSDKRPMSIRINEELRYQLKMRAVQDRRTCTSIVEELLTGYLARPAAKG